jgi:hypothetical protein
MTINIESLIPAIAGAFSTLSLVWINNRVQLNKSRTESVKAGAEAGAITAKSEADIFQMKWDKIVSALERRVERAEASEDEAQRRLLVLEAQLDDCSSKLRRAGFNGDEDGKPA